MLDDPGEDGDPSGHRSCGETHFEHLRLIHKQKHRRGGNWIHAAERTRAGDGDTQRSALAQARILARSTMPKALELDIALRT